MFDMPTENEDRFISWWRANECQGLVFQRTEQVTTWVGQRPFLLFGGGDVFRLSPRGADLLATADAIGYDPSAKPEPAEVSPPMKPCADCNGEGRVPVGQLGGRDRTMKELVEGPDARGEQDPTNPVVLPGWSVTCTTCMGAKVVPVITMKDVVAASTPVAQVFAGVASALASSVPTFDAVAAEAAKMGVPEPGFADSAKRLRVDGGGSVRFAFGKHSGGLVRHRPRYVAWMQTVEFYGNTAEVAREICETEGHDIDALVRELR